MKLNKYTGIVMSMILLFSIIVPMTGNAEETRKIQDESIYDLLVDRFNNGNFENDINIDTQEPNMFSGGDFAGLIDRDEYISEMGFTMISIGSIFSTETYDGQKPLDYEELEPHFGTKEELERMIAAFREKNIGVMADFPLNEVSENHTWVKEERFPTIDVENGKVNWDPLNEELKSALKEAVVSFASDYDWQGIRLTNLGSFDVDYLNELIDELKGLNPELYILTNEETVANFDSVPNMEKYKTLQQTYAEFDSDSSGLSLFSTEDENDLIYFDTLNDKRFTQKMIDENMFPPARWQVALPALFTLPGVPLLTYESEIAVSGEEAPDTHPIVNFKTDTELYDLISDLNFLRNESAALRTGDFELLHNESGFVVYTRSSDEETWVIALNNTSETKNFSVSKDFLGDDKRLRGVLTGESIPKTKDENYNIVLDREVADIYIVENDRGFNTPYLIASILVYVLFLGFIYTVWRNGRKRAKEENA